MKHKIYTICGRPVMAVRVATCENGNYTNFTRPKRQSK